MNDFVLRYVSVWGYVHPPKI